jgi:hypothetical protein
MPDLVYSRNSNNEFLTSNQIREKAPAVYAHDYAEDLSSKYGNFNSAQAIDVMDAYGYGVTQAAQVKGRTTTANLHGQHLMAFAKRHEVSASTEEQPEIIFYNSHDGKSSMKLFAGVYRFICSNGLIAGDGFDQRMVHYKSNLDSFEDLLTYTANSLEDIAQLTHSMKNITPEREQVALFAEKALETRYDLYVPTKNNWDQLGWLERNMFDKRAIKQTLTATRPQDAANDAWTIFNRVQESVIRGGFDVLGERKRRGQVFLGYKQAKALSSIKENVSVNRKLWDIAQETLAA